MAKSCVRSGAGLTTVITDKNNFSLNVFVPEAMSFPINFEKIEEMNQNINDILAKNPNAILKKIDFNYLDEEKTKLNFEINIEVVNR